MIDYVVLLNIINFKMLKKYIFSSLLFCFLSGISFGQSIVNTEKLFNKNKDGLQVSSEFNGTSISGNASVFILGYSLNFSYKKNKSSEDDVYKYCFECQNKNKTNFCTQHVLNLYFLGNSMNNLFTLQYLKPKCDNVKIS